jgi:hypothetical protein
MIATSQQAVSAAFFHSKFTLCVKNFNQEILFHINRNETKNYGSTFHFSSESSIDKVE